MADDGNAPSYTAFGPSEFGFRTGAQPEGITNGVVATGTKIGVHGKGDGFKNTTPDTSIGVFEESGGGFGVHGFSQIGKGVYGATDIGTGVQGDGRKGTGVLGTGKIGVHGEGDQIGVHGFNKNGDGVFGDSEIGAGVDGHSDLGAGVHGRCDRSYGGVFTSNFAQIRLEPANSLGPPTGPHNKGEFFVDKEGALFYCYDNVPGSWAKLAGPSLFNKIRDFVVRWVGP
jgi:hypothetical protein